MPEIRLIDANALHEILCSGCTKYSGGICRNEYGRCAEYTIIKQMQTIEAEPIRHGRWSECWHDDRLYSGICSECEKASVRPVGSDPLPICPKCGAKMQTEPPEEVQDDE